MASCERVMLYRLETGPQCQNNKIKNSTVRSRSWPGKLNFSPTPAPRKPRYIFAGPQFFDHGERTGKPLRVPLYSRTQRRPWQAHLQSRPIFGSADVDRTYSRSLSDTQGNDNCSSELRGISHPTDFKLAVSACGLLGRQPMPLAGGDRGDGLQFPRISDFCFPPASPKTHTVET